MRRCVVYLLPLVAGMAPAAAFGLSLYRAEHRLPRGAIDKVALILLAPGVYPGFMFHSVIVQLVAAGLFWYLLGMVLLAVVLLPKRNRPREYEGIYVRPVMWIAVLLLAYGLIVARMAIGWNPD